MDHFTGRFPSIPRLLAIGAVCLLSTSLLYGQSTAIPVQLQCEYLVDPLGIDAKQPRLTWQLADAREGALQTGYQICVGTDSLDVSKGNGSHWKVSANSNVQLLRYAGKALVPFTRYYWRVVLKDKNRVATQASRMAFFETGMMGGQNWQGAWISDSRDVNTKPAPSFRHVHELTKKVRSARAYIAVAGLYELYVNGKRIGDHRLDPMYTRFDRRTLYVTHDITAALQQGLNAFGVTLGNGWYNHQSTAVWFFHEAPWRNRPTFCMDIRIVYTDGSIEVIGTGKNWKTSISPVVFNSIYTAEHYDARLEQGGWNTAQFNDSAWKDISFRSSPSGNIVTQVLHPIKNVERIPPTAVNKISDSVYVVDLGRNISGVSEFTVEAPRGTVIRLKHGERRYPDGRVDQSNIDVHYRPTGTEDPFQTDIFITAGTGKETFRPAFNYKGFQYVEISSSIPLPSDRFNLTGIFMHSDVPVAGSIHSSNPTIDGIARAVNNSYLSNLFGYPTDCPQREKNGWTGDAHIAVESGLYNFDAVTVYEKWMADHRDEQQPNGVLPSIIPTDGWGYEWGNGPDWTSSIALIPWNIYLFYGDPTALRDCYESIRRYVDYITLISPTGLTTWGLGDWVPVKSKTPVEFTSTAYYYTDVLILANAAALFGKKEDERHYRKLAGKIKTTFNEKYYHADSGTYGDGLQTELSVALHWGLVTEESRARVAANLAARVRKDNNHLDVGLLGTKTILNALSDNGYADLAYTVAAQEDYPSWGWWIKNGATILYENWPIDAQSDISMNHIMFGEIGAWLYKAPGGIKPDPAAPGFKSILLAPHFVKGLDHFEATHNGPFGLIRSSWQRTGNYIRYEVTVPPNSTARLQLDLDADQALYFNGMSWKAAQGPFISILMAGKHTMEIRQR